MVTPTAEGWMTRANEWFDSASWSLMQGKDLNGKASVIAADWTYDESTWTTDAWTKLYTVSSTLNTQWSSYVNTYNGAYKGTDMQDEYNSYIATGTMQKRAGLN